METIKKSLPDQRNTSNCSSQCKSTMSDVSFSCLCLGYIILADCCFHSNMALLNYCVWLDGGGMGVRNCSLQHHSHGLSKQIDRDFGVCGIHQMFPGSSIYNTLGLDELGHPLYSSPLTQQSIKGARGQREPRSPYKSSNITRQSPQQ